MSHSAYKAYKSYKVSDGVKMYIHQELCDPSIWLEWQKFILAYYFSFYFHIYLHLFVHSLINVYIETRN